MTPIAYVVRIFLYLQSSDQYPSTGRTATFCRMRSSLLRMRSSLLRMRSSLVVRASDCQCTGCNGPGFDPSIRRHSGIWGAADEAVLNRVRKKKKKSPKKIFLKKIFCRIVICTSANTTWRTAGTVWSVQNLPTFFARYQYYADSE